MNVGLGPCRWPATSDLPAREISISAALPGPPQLWNHIFTSGGSIPWLTPVLTPVRLPKRHCRATPTTSAPIHLAQGSSRPKRAKSQEEVNIDRQTLGESSLQLIQNCFVPLYPAFPRSMCCLAVHAFVGLLLSSGKSSPQHWKQKLCLPLTKHGLRQEEKRQTNEN